MEFQDVILQNQINHIISKSLNKILLQKSRSYDGVGTKTGDKLVEATFKLDWWRMKEKHKPSETVNIEKLKEPVSKHLYASELNEKLR